MTARIRGRRTVVRAAGSGARAAALDAAEIRRGHAEPGSAAAASRVGCLLRRSGGSGLSVGRLARFPGPAIRGFLRFALLRGAIMQVAKASVPG